MPLTIGLCCFGPLLRKLHCFSPSKLDDDSHDQTKTTISRSKYARWIANAISTDTVAFGFVDKDQPTALAPVAQQRLLKSIHPTGPNPTNIIKRVFWRFLKYSQISLGIILSVLLLQIFAALFFWQNC